MSQTRQRALRFSSVCFLLLLFPRGVVVQAGADPVTSDATRTRIQQIVADLLARLTLSENVAISVVPKNPLMLSVEFDDTDTGFLLSLEEDFVNELTDQELRAAIAHELGHVWIFRHHPFLQTEALANQIAERLVPRDDLVQVYEKVWGRLGRKGDPARFVGN